MTRILLALLVAFITGALAAGAQGSSGTLAVGQPLPSQLQAGAATRYDYSLTQPSEVTIQALGDTAQPTITIRRDQTIVAAQPNSDGALTTSLTALLDPGTYVVEVGTANDTSGLVVVLLQTEIPISATTLAPATLTNGVVNPAAPLALYRFSAMPEPAYLYVESASASSGVSVRLVNTTGGTVSGEITPDVLGGRLRIAPGSAEYQVEVRQSAPGSSADAFTICYTAVSLGGCETGSSVPVAQPTLAQPTLIAPPNATEEATTCMVTASASGGVNIRQSASTASVILGRLPNGVSAEVFGISPNRDFVTIFYNGLNGWVALSVVTTSGDCGSAPVIAPPPIIVPTQPPATPQPPTAPPPPTASGPCLVTINSPTYVYSTTNDDIGNLFDQLQGGELIPIGRLANNSWWKTNYYNTWIKTSAFGQTASVSGDCSSLPVVTP
jgi:hypothetical protein